MASDAATAALDSLVCGICMSVCTEPVVAACTAHTFCRTHLAAWIAARRAAGRTVECPCCRMRIQQDVGELRVHGGLAAAIAALTAPPSAPVLSRDDIVISSTRLGRGASCDVFDGTWLGVPVAVKVLHVDGGVPAAARAAFVREVGFLTVLQHPHILRIFGACDAARDSGMLLVMQRGERSLSAAIPRPGGLPLAETLRIGLAIARALHYLHTRPRPVAHCDLKPSNVILTADGTPLLADFNVSRVATTAGVFAGATAGGGLRGTTNYAAPESFDDSLPGYGAPAADIYSLGCLLFEMATGAVPWGGLAVLPVLTRVGRGERPPLPTDGTCAALAPLITVCWAHAPAERPSAAAAVQRLVALQAETVPPQLLKPSDSADVHGGDDDDRGFVVRLTDRGRLRWGDDVDCVDGIAFWRAAHAGERMVRLSVHTGRIDEELWRTLGLEPTTNDHLTAFAGVHALSVRGADLSFVTVDAFMVLSRAGLRVLDISSCFRVGAMFPALGNLVALDVSNCLDFDDAALMHVRRARSLDLSGCTQLGDAAIAHLVGAGDVSDCRVHVLLLYGCKRVTDAGIAHLRRLRQPLQLLDLTHTRATGAAYAHIAGVRTLVHHDCCTREAAAFSPLRGIESLELGSRNTRAAAVAALCPPGSTRPSVISHVWHVFFKDLAGRTHVVWVTPWMLIEGVKRLISHISGIPAWDQRLLFAGRQLEDTRSISDYNIQVEATLHLVLRLRGTIGVFVARGEPAVCPHDGAWALKRSAEDAPGAAWLSAPALPSPLPARADVAALVTAVRGRGSRCSNESNMQTAQSQPSLPVVHIGNSDGLRVGSVPLLPAPACASLVALVDAAWHAAVAASGTSVEAAIDANTPCIRASSATADSGSNDVASSPRPASRALLVGVASGNTLADFRLPLLPGDVRAHVGDGAFEALCVLLDGGGKCGSSNPPGDTLAAAPTARDPDALVLRRTAATGRWINWHTDPASATVQVPLLDAGIVGGSLVFATADGRLLNVCRAPGVPLWHDGDVVHGVTALTAGVRYGLYALRARRAVTSTMGDDVGR